MSSRRIWPALPTGAGASTGRRVQYAALPYRVRRDGEVQIRLITSRETRRWVIPKGWPIKGLTPPKTAARETYEEAGLVGVVGREPLGLYTYEKRLGTRSVLCDVLVFPFKVKRSLQKWPERFQRYGFWFSIDSAAAAVQEEDLSELIRAFGDLMARRWAAKLEEKAAGRGKEAAAPASVEDAGGEMPAAASAKKSAKAKGKGAVEAPEAAASAPAVAAAEGAPGGAESAAGIVEQPDRAKKASAKDGKAKTAKAEDAKAKGVPADPAVVASGAGATLAGRQDVAGSVLSLAPVEGEPAPAEGKAPKPRALKAGAGKPVDGKSGAGKSEMAAPVAVPELAGDGLSLSGPPDLPAPSDTNGQSTKAGSDKTESEETDSDKSAPAKAGSGKASSSKAKPKKTGPGKA